MIRVMIVKTTNLCMLVLFLLSMFATEANVQIVLFRVATLVYFFLFLISNGYMKLKRGRGNEE